MSREARGVWGAMTTIATVVLCLVMTSWVWAEAGWIDELTNSLSFYKTTYPGSGWDRYEKKLAVVREAVNRGDQGTVKTEMGAFFKMLRARAHGINDVAADELFNFAMMVTPIQEYQISIPGGAPGQ